MSEVNFQCIVCSKTLKTKKNLEKHCRLHKKVKNLECDFCALIFNNKTDISHHIDIHRKYSILQCKVCSLKFTTTKILKDHLKGHFEPKICEFCAKPFSRSVELKLHIASKHIRELKYPCAFCSRLFTTKKIRKEHEARTHLTNKSPAFKCPECVQYFPMREDLRVHSFEHYSGRVYKCTDGCGKKFKTPQALKLHLRSHRQEKIYRCLRCAKSFAQPSGLGKHLKRCNGGFENNDKKTDWDREKVVEVASAQYQEILKAKGRLRKTDEVKKATKKIKQLSRNSVKDATVDKAEDDRISDGESFEGSGVREDLVESTNSTPSVQTQLRCDFCASIFNSKRGILLHLRCLHLKGNEGQVKKLIELESCHLCAKTFKSKWRRQLHEKNSHKQEPVECEVCKKRLKHKVCLKEHMKNFHQPGFQRQKPPPVTCSQCLKQFVGRTKLDRHVKNVHEKISNGKEYRCQECEAVFSRKNDLREHSFLHISSDDIFSCLICCQQFYTLAKLKFHHFTHNPQQVHCNICQKVFARQASLRKHQKTCHLVQSSLFVSGQS